MFTLVNIGSASPSLAGQYSVGVNNLWDQAELTRWQPSFTGKRSWATVRQRLLHAADHKVARSGALLDRLFIPEPFSVEQRDAINIRRVAQWARAVAEPSKLQSLMLLIAEVKEIVPARFGFKMVIKHMPDQAFATDEKLYRQLGRRFAEELSLWGSADSLHMVVIATFGISMAGVASIQELSLMPVTAQWLPVANAFEQKLIETLVHGGRSFIKGLRYNLPASHDLANALLVDVEDSPVALSIMVARFAGQSHGGTSAQRGLATNAAWCWQPDRGAMPPLPRQRSQRYTSGTDHSTA